jgi:hypothetical protein
MPRRPLHNRDAARVAILSDHPLKAVASIVGCSQSGAAKLAHALGFRRCYVTDRERAEVMQRRRATV